MSIYEGSQSLISQNMQHLPKPGCIFFQFIFLIYLFTVVILAGVCIQSINFTEDATPPNLFASRSKRDHFLSRFLGVTFLFLEVSQYFFLGCHQPKNSIASFRS